MTDQKERKAPGSWSHYFGDEHAQVTMQEYVAGCLARSLNIHIRTMEGIEHVEGMLGAMDQLFEAFAQAQGIPYASSKEVREALAFYRDHQRQETIKKLELDRGKESDV